MSPVLGKKTVRALRELVVAACAEKKTGEAWKTLLLAELDACLRPKKFVTSARARAKTRKAETRSEWEQIRAKVFKRADGQCENCGITTDALTPDHVFQGANRKTLQSIYTVRAICAVCDRQRTLNIPDAGYWLIRFIEHCAREANKYGDMAEDEPNGYAHAAEIAKRKLESLEILGQMEAKP